MAFTGDERFMMLSEYYRQNNYHPLYVLRSSLSILIEVPFFIAAYHFLSHCDALSGKSFLFLKDLGLPDAIFSIPIGSIVFTVNILPILMTVINIFSGVVYLKSAPLREKIQVYAMAGLFLIILYNSPSGLVFYWILNNAFSLVKNIVVKMKHPKRIAFATVALALLTVALYGFIKNLVFDRLMKRVTIFLIIAILFCLIPVFYNFIKKYIQNRFPKKEIQNIKPSKNTFSILLFSGMALALVSGFLIPSSAIASSPVEFSFLGSTSSPLSYLFSSFTFFIGLFVFWPLCIYKMFGDKVKRTESILFLFLLLLVLANVYIFKYDIGTISVLFHIDNPESLKNFNPFFSLLPFIYCILVVGILFLLYKFKLQKYISITCFALCIGMFALGLVNTNKINKAYNEYKIVYEKQKDIKNELISTNGSFQPVYHFSKTGTNVLFLFLDRAINSFWPYILNDFPEMNEQFSGFVYYPNTLSYSTNTVMGAPAMMAGYEYTPENINARSDVKLVDKHNESLLMLPKIFSDAGYKVTVTDPPFSNYQWKGDLTPFKDYPEMKVKELDGIYNDSYKKIFSNDFSFEDLSKTCNLNIKMFSVLQMIPPIARNFFYQEGNYLTTQKSISENKFLDHYSTLYFLREITQIDDNGNNYTFIDNDAPHEYQILKNDYTPGNPETITDAQCGSYPYLTHYSSGGETDFVAYQVNVASLKRVGIWFDYLKENGVYDNTRIIIVADHGRQIPFEVFNGWKNGSTYAGYTPLFMVKDFNAKGKPKTDTTFMTNADAPYFAIKDLPVSNVNPFTGKTLDPTNQKDNLNIYQCLNFNAFEIRRLNEFELDRNQGFNVHDNIFNQDNWKRLSEIKVEE